jgi:hypothetical protein
LSLILKTFCWVALLYALIFSCNLPIGQQNLVNFTRKGNSPCAISDTM